MPKDLREKLRLTYRPVPLMADPVNLRILEELTQNPRLTMSELGRRVALSSPAVTERVRRLEEGGVIRGYRTEIDPVALGLPLAAFIRLRANPGQVAKIAEVAQTIPEIVECHCVLGEDSFILKVHLPDLAQLDRVLNCFLPYGITTTALIQSSPVQPRALPLPLD